MKLFQLFESKELATELLWFRRFISENDLETEIEVEGDELVVYQDGKELCKWDAVEAKRIRTEVLIDATESRWYAEYVLKGPFELGEPIIATDAVESRYYAQIVLKGRFELGEKAIATDANQTCHYAQFVVKGPFELGEPIIAKEAFNSRWYAQHVLKGRFELGEKVIATDVGESQKYKKFLATIKRNRFNSSNPKN